MKKQKGYIALMMILIISAVALALAATVSLLAINEMQSSFALYKGDEGLALSEGCMEDALQKIHDSSSYVGGTITRPEGTCAITVAKVGTVYTVTATTTSVTYKRTIQTVVNRGTTLTITSWKEF